MKTLRKIIGSFFILIFLVACSQSNVSISYKITGEVISMLPESTEEMMRDTDTSDDETDTLVDETNMPYASKTNTPIDLSNAKLTISYDSINDKGNIETVLLVEDSFDGFFEFEDEVLQPTKITISLQIEKDSNPRQIHAVIGTGSDIRFAFVDNPGPYDEFLIVGSSNQVLNSENKFSVSGDLSFLDFDEANTVSASLSASFRNFDGESQMKQWGPVLVTDNSFRIEGDVDRPVVALLSFLGDRMRFVHIILEPQSDLVVTELGNQTKEIAVTSGSGYHALIIETWQQNAEYISLVEAWTSERSLNRAANSVATEGEDNVVDSNNIEPDSEDENVADLDDTIEAEENVELDEDVVPVAGCEDSVVQVRKPVVIDELSNYLPPKWQTLQEKATDFQVSQLQQLAITSDDPTAQLLAMQMDAFSPYEDADEALEVWRSLAEKFDEEFVAAYIEPNIDRFELVKRRLDNDAVLVPGQKVPQFTLTNLEGTEIAIYDLLEEKDMVLIDFWASWCGPCIGSFPHLKDLYAAYSDKDFEIVGVSVDESMDDWSSGVDDNELPWVQLGELNEAANGNPVVESYGVNFIPKTFLVDSQGCIYQKNIRPEALKDFLVSRYGLDDSLVETEEKP